MHPMLVHPISSKIHKDLKAHIDSNIVVVGDFNTLPFTNRQVIQKKSTKKS
jgi:hypothetical protein